MIYCIHLQNLKPKFVSPTNSNLIWNCIVKPKRIDLFHSTSIFRLSRQHANISCKMLPENQLSRKKNRVDHKCLLENFVNVFDLTAQYNLCTHHHPKSSVRYIVKSVWVVCGWYECKSTQMECNQTLVYCERAKTSFLIGDNVARSLLQNYVHPANAKTKWQVHIWYRWIIENRMDQRKSTHTCWGFPP